MHSVINKIKQFRIHLLKEIETLTAEQLNKVPSGYNNNIIWNLGHILAAEQNMCYVRSGMDAKMNENYFTEFKSGTKPERIYTPEEIKEIKSLVITSAEQLQVDYDQKLFNSYSSSVMIAKVYGFEVTNIDEALEYILYHDGLHTGYIHAMKRMV